MRVTPLALVGPPLDTAFGWQLGIASDSAESITRREKWRADGAYRAQVKLVLAVAGPTTEVREVARSLRRISSFNLCVQVFDASSGERLSVAQDEDVLSDIDPNGALESVPPSPFESVWLAPDVALSVAVVHINLLTAPAVGTRCRLDLRALAAKFGPTSDGGFPMEFPTETVELVLVDS